MVKSHFEYSSMKDIWRIPLAASVAWGTVTAIQKYEDVTSKHESQTVQAKKVDFEAQTVVKHINNALYFLKQCPDENAGDAADRFEALNREAKLVYINSGILGNQLVSITTVIKDTRIEAQISISKERFAQSSVSTIVLAADIYRSIYIYDRIKDNPKRYAKDLYFKGKLEHEAAESAKAIVCQELK